MLLNSDLRTWDCSVVDLIINLQGKAQCQQLIN